MPDNILTALNPRQREAVETISGPVLIVAGPGSGKTRVITHRIAYLVDRCGVQPYRIAALTFTNKAAREMRERAADLMRTSGDQVTISTFHSFCARVLRRHGELLGLDKDYTIYDQSDQTSLVKRAMEENNINDKQFSPGKILSAISGAKSKLLGVEGYGLKKADYYEEIVHRVYERYEDLLAQSSALDFDDLILKTHTLLREHSEVAESYRDRYVHVMVDEFQDTNVAQYEIAKQFTGEYRNLCVVGDPDQSIYSWRNADIRNILSFQKDFAEAKLISLEENYRSTETILEAAQGVIAPNRQRLEQNLFTKLGRGVPIVVHESYDENDEAQFVVSEIESLLHQGYKLSHIAVMYRVNAQSRALEEMCLRYDVPYHLVGIIKFYQRQEIKDLVSYLRLIANHNDDVSFRRIVNVPTRGIGQRTMSELDRLAWEHGTSLYAAIDETAEMLKRPGNYVAPLPARSINALQDFKAMIDDLTDKSAEYEPAALIDAVLKRTGYGDHIESDAERGEERMENIRELQTVAKDLLDYGEEDSLTAFLERVSLVSDADNVGESPDAVTLITLHQAKGLEFPVVFIVGHGGRCHAPHALHRLRRPRRDRGGAPPLLRRRHPRQGEAPSRPRLPAWLQRPQRLRARHAVPVPRRHPAGAARKAGHRPGKTENVRPRDSPDIAVFYHARSAARRAHRPPDRIPRRPTETPRRKRPSAERPSRPQYGRPRPSQDLRRGHRHRGESRPRRH